MGKRDEVMLATSPEDLKKGKFFLKLFIISDPRTSSFCFLVYKVGEDSTPDIVFEEGAVAAVECSFKPLDADHGGDVENLPDYVAQGMTEGDRKPVRKKNRKHRSQGRRKQRENNKVSSESETEPSSSLEKDDVKEVFSNEISVEKEEGTEQVWQSIFKLFLIENFLILTFFLKHVQSSHLKSDIFSEIQLKTEATPDVADP